MNPYCFVITSFGEKENLNDLKSKQAKGISDPIQKINSDQIYNELIKLFCLPLSNIARKWFMSLLAAIYTKSRECALR